MWVFWLASVLFFPKPFSKMKGPVSALESAVQAKAAALASQRADFQSSRTRLVADPYISVDQIQTCLEPFLQVKGCADLLRCIGPPASLVNVTWQTAPHGPWMVKVCDLIYDMLLICKNTKLQQTKVRKALTSMLTARTLDLPPGNFGSKEDVLDRLDLSLRIVLCMFRETKAKPIVRNRMMRTLNREEQVKLNLCLDRVELPEEYMGGDLDESQEQGHVLAIEDDPERTLVREDSKPKLQASFPKAKPRSPLIGLPTIFTKILGKEKVQQESTSPREAPLKALNVSRPDGSFSSGVKRTVSDNDLLTSVLNFVPPQVLGKKGKATQPKKAKGKAKAKAKAKTTKKDQKKKSKKPATKKTKAKKPEPAPAQRDESEDDGNMAEDYKVTEKPLPTDCYKNQYVSRQWHRAKHLALSMGLDEEKAKEKGRLVSSQARALWDEHVRDQK